MFGSLRVIKVSKRGVLVFFREFYKVFVSIFFVTNEPFLVLPKYGVLNLKSYIIGTRSHGGDGGNAMSRRCRRHKERRRCSVQILDNDFGLNALYINY